MPQHGTSWSAEDWSQKTGSLAAVPQTTAKKDLLKIRKKLRQIAKIEEMAAADAKVDTLQRQKLAQKEALIAQLGEAERAVAEEEVIVAMEQQRQHQQQHERMQQHATQLQHGQLLQEQQQQQQQEHQHQILQQAIAEITQSLSPASYSWIPVTPVQLVGALAPICDEHGQQVQEIQLMQPAMVEHPQLTLQAWAVQQQQEQQQWQEQQQLHMQLQLLPKFHISKEHAVSPEAGFRQHPALEVRLDVPKAPSNGQIDMLMESLNGDNDAKKHALDSLRGSVVCYAFDEHGCRAVQLAFQVADNKVAAELLSELRGHVYAASRSLHANYVIQRAIEVMPAAACAFIAEEMRGVGAVVARHRFGCRILCRLLEHMADNPACAELIAEVLAEANQLCRREFGHYVLQSVLEHGQPHQRGCLIQALMLQGPRLASHRCGCHVLEAALVHGSAEEQQDIGAALLTLGSSGMVMLASSQYGSYVIKALLRTGVAAALVAAEQLRHAEARLQRNKYGKRVLEEASQQALRVA